MADAQKKSNLDPQRLQQLSLTAWELETSRGDEPLGAAARGVVMKTHERLAVELEKWTDVDPDKRSQIRVREDAKAAVLLVHGSTGSPSDLHSLTTHLYERGFTVFNVLLPGHGHDDQGLPDIKWKACLNEVDLCYGILQRVYGKVHVVGFSFGGALAINLCRKAQPASLVLLAPALNPKVGFGTRMMLALGLHRLPFVCRRVGWNLQVFEAMEKAKSHLGKLKPPVYAAHCDDDQRIDASSLRLLQRKARHRASRFRLYPTGGHMILEAHGNTSLHTEVGDFLKNR